MYVRGANDAAGRLAIECRPTYIGGVNTDKGVGTAASDPEGI